MKREQFANNAVDTLDGAIDDTVTTLDVNSASEFPTDGNFRILIGSEIMLVTSVSTNTFTVVRAQEGTAAASHSNGDTVTQLLTVESLRRVVADDVPLAGISTRPPLGRIEDASGNVVTSSAFTWLNQGSATISDHGGNMRLYTPGSGSLNLRGMYMTAPATPYGVKMCFSKTAMTGLNAGNDSQSFGMFFRESATSKIRWFVVTRDSGAEKVLIETFTNETTYVATQVNQRFQAFWPLWMRIQDNGSNLLFDFSENGIDWNTLETLSRGLHFTTAPDQVGFAVNSGSVTSAKLSMSILHWSFE